MLERRAAQPVSAQMLHAGGECEGRGVDGGRPGVSQETKSKGEQPMDQVRRWTFAQKIRISASFILVNLYPPAAAMLPDPGTTPAKTH